MCESGTVLRNFFHVIVLDHSLATTFIFIFFELLDKEVSGCLHAAMSPGRRMSSGARIKLGLSSADGLMA